MKIPPEILSVFEEECKGLLYGEVGLTLYLRDGQPRFEVTRKRSIYAHLSNSDDKGSLFRPKTE